MQSKGNKSTTLFDKVSVVMQFAGTTFCVVILY